MSCTKMINSSVWGPKQASLQINDSQLRNDKKHKQENMSLWLQKNVLKINVQRTHSLFIPSMKYCSPSHRGWDTVDHHHPVTGVQHKSHQLLLHTLNLVTYQTHHVHFCPSRHSWGFTSTSCWFPVHPHWTHHTCPHKATDKPGPSESADPVSTKDKLQQSKPSSPWSCSLRETVQNLLELDYTVTNVCSDFNTFSLCSFNNTAALKKTYW